MVSDLNGGMRLPRPHLCPLEVWNLIEKCWCSDPDERPSFKELKTFLYQQYLIQTEKNKASAEADDKNKTPSTNYQTCYEGMLNNQTMQNQFNAICEYNLNYLSVLEEKEMGSPGDNVKEENSLSYLCPKRHSTQHTEFVELDEGETMSSEYVIKVDDSFSYFTPNEFDENIDKLIYENNLTEMNQKT